MMVSLLDENRLWSRRPNSWRNFAKHFPNQFAGESPTGHIIYIPEGDHYSDKLMEERQWNNMATKLEDLILRQIQMDRLPGNIRGS